ncbi:MAG: coenzyme F420-0:L-glutamate ligase [Candidatus Nezhaarchaeales archaeon]|nr:MAG: hypothetical protein DRJ60_00765 [Thermoprotei archaeon]
MQRILKWRNYIAIPLKSDLWKPKTDFKRKTVELIKNVASNGDYVVLSEKALSTALGLLYDESIIPSDFYSKLMTFLITRVLWGKALGKLCKLSHETVELLRRYPINEGSRHKKLALKIGGLLQALKPTSEAGIDTTNVPGHLVSLPLTKPFEIACELREYIAKKLRVNLKVVIVDSDKCYKLKTSSNLILACRSTRLPSLINLGFLSFLIARSLRRFFSPYATPIGFSPLNLEVNELLIISELADRARGVGAGRTLYEVEKTFGIKATDVTWDLLNSIPHYPVVVVKKIRGLRPSSRRP